MDNHATRGWIIMDSPPQLSTDFHRLMHKVSGIDRALRVFFGIKVLGHGSIRITQSLMFPQLFLNQRKARFLGTPEHPTESNVCQPGTLSTPDIGMNPTEPYFLKPITDDTTLS